MLPLAACVREWDSESSKAKSGKAGSILLELAKVQVGIQ